MGFIWTIIIGAIAGALAKLIVPGRQGGGFIVTILLGVVGAFVGTWLGQALGFQSANDGVGIVGATIGAIIVLLVWGALTRRRT